LYCSQEQYSSLMNPPYEYIAESQMGVHSNH
jgi:hypothetical protein